MAKKQFLRRSWNKYLRLGGRRKKLKWRKAKGRHSKMREQKKGYAHPSVGHKKARILRGLLNGKKSIMVCSLKDLEKIKENNIAIISSKMGTKKKIQIAEAGIKNKIKFFNLDAPKFLEEIKKIKTEKEEKKKPAKEKKEESTKEESKKEIKQ